MAYSLARCLCCLSALPLLAVPAWCAGSKTQVYGVFPPTPEERRVLEKHEEWRRTLQQWHEKELQAIRDDPSLSEEAKQDLLQQAQARQRAQMAQVLRAQEAERRKLWLVLTPIPEMPKELLSVLTLEERQHLEGLRKGKRDQILGYKEFHGFTPQQRRKLLWDTEESYNLRYARLLATAKARLEARRQAAAQRAAQRAPARSAKKPAPAARASSKKPKRSRGTG